MNETIKTIYERRAVRKYKPIEVARKIIEQVLDAGRMAPSALDKQPLKFYVLTSRKTINAFSKAIRVGVVKGVLKMPLKRILKMASSALHFPRSADFDRAEDRIFYGAPVVIFITSPMYTEWGDLDAGMCAQNMMLAAKSLGLDTCPVGVAKYVEETRKYAELNIPNTDKVELAILLGYGDEAPAVHERIKDNLSFCD